MLTNLDDVLDIFSGTDNVIIFGAGRVGYALLQYIAHINNMLLDNVYCIMVSDKKYNPDNILGIPVCQKDAVGAKKDAGVVIATFENAHSSILGELSQYEYRQVHAISNLLYAELRKCSKDLSVDIIQNTQWNKCALERIEKKINFLDDKLTNKLINNINRLNANIVAINQRTYRIEACIRNGVRTYEEILSVSEYEKELKRWYKEKTGEVLDLDNPQTYNEKIQWIKLYGVTPLMITLTDKYAVREWIKQKIGEEYLVPLLGVWDRFEDIDFQQLPQKFVLKCNHGCGWNIIVKDKSQINYMDMRRKIERWLNTNYAYCGGFQLQYKDICPKIIAEEYIENNNGDLYDYKFWCFAGKVQFIMFLSERQKWLRMNNYDKNWNLLPFTYDYPNCEKEIPRPENLDKMIQIAEELAQGFPHVRVDLYRLNDGIIKFGEMTFTSCNGVCNWSDEDINYRLGTLINLK